MANEGGKIGEAYVEVLARLDSLESGLADAKLKLASFGTDAERAGQKVSVASAGMGQSFRAGTKEALSGLLAVRGALSAVSGATFGLIGTIGLLTTPFVLIYEHVKRVKAETLALASTIQEIQRDAQQTILDVSLTSQRQADALGQSIQAIEKALASREFADTTNPRVRAARERLFAEIRELSEKQYAFQQEADRQLEADRQQANDREYESKTRAIQDNLAKERDANAAIARIGNDRVATIEDEYDIRIKRAKEDATIAANSGDASLAAIYQERVGLLQNAKIREVNAELAERTAKADEKAAQEQERAARAAKDFSDSIARARIESVQFQDRQQAGFGLGDIQGSLEDLKTAVRSLSGQIR